MITQTITANPKDGIRIPASILKKAGMPVNKGYVIKIKTPIINIVPQKNEKEEKDWLDELLEDPIAQKNFERIVREAEEDYQAGRCRPIEELFKEMGIE